MLSRLEALLVLNALQEEISFSRFAAWLKAFGSPEAIFEQPEEKLAAAAPRGAKAAFALKRWPEVFDLAREIKLIQENKITLAGFGEVEYPASLLPLFEPPILLYCRGSLLPEDAQAVAIVGSRASTHYGKTSAHTLAKDLAQYRWTVVSGLAYGIDTAAHLGALDGGGRTLAVLGHGLGTPVYPPENEKLAGRIALNGAVISEFPMTFAPLPRNFPRRNRVIAGLSRGVIMVEGARKSGAFITVDCALEQGKPALAVPGRIDLRSAEGPNLLIQQGAKLVTGAKDILEELDPQFQAGAQKPGEQKYFSLNESLLETDEKALLGCLSSEEKQLETLLEETRLSSPQLTHALFSLEIKNLVKQLPGQYYVRI